MLQPHTRRSGIGTPHDGADLNLTGQLDGCLVVHSHQRRFDIGLGIDQELS